ncbi:hypothetical protein Taro_011763 [Colocasia esculenta]|uniref:Uncharacterized protein n=1 Tax=Colocasia esculenta TaxID=4460 RepID=A0A843UDM1_COLES|nr:hypothetical protein [Colocasia esculenta]
MTRNCYFHADPCFLITLSRPIGITRVIPYLSTRLNLLNPPGSHRTLRELPRQLHYTTAFPRTIQQRHTSHDPPTTLLYLLEALGTRGHEAGARGRENQVENLLSGDPITHRIHRLASTPLPPRATATINVHILCRQVHAVNGTLPGRQQVNGHPWPPTPTQLQQVLFHFRTKPAPHLNKPHIQTTHSTQPTHTGLSTAITTITHMIRMDPKSTRRITRVIPYLSTSLNLPNPPGSHRTLRELPRQLHHTTVFPRAIQQRHTSHDPPTTLLYLLEALGTRGHEAGARERENQVENLLSGDPITCRIHRLASTPLPPRAIATINVNILCRQVHAVNRTLPGRQQVNGHPWPPTPTQLQQAQAPTPVPHELGHGGPSIMERFKRMAPPSFKGESQPLLAESWMREIE